MATEKAKDKKLYLMDVVFKTPIMGRGAVRAANEEEAIEKTLEAYESQDDVHVISVKETTEDALDEELATLNNDDEDDESEDTTPPTVH